MAKSLNKAAQYDTQMSRSNCFSATITSLAFIQLYLHGHRKTVLHFLLWRQHLPLPQNCLIDWLQTNETCAEQGQNSTSHVLLNAVDRNLLLCKAHCPWNVKHHKGQKMLWLLHAAKGLHPSHTMVHSYLAVPTNLELCLPTCPLPSLICWECTGMPWAWHPSWHWLICWPKWPLTAGSTLCLVMFWWSVGLSCVASIRALLCDYKACTTGRCGSDKA